MEYPEADFDIDIRHFAVSQKLTGAVFRFDGCPDLLISTQVWVSFSGDVDDRQLPAMCSAAGFHLKARIDRTRSWTRPPDGDAVRGRRKPAPRSLLLDVPQERHRRDDDAVEVLAIGGRDDELAGRHVRDIVGVGLDLDLVGELLLGCRGRAP